MNLNEAVDGTVIMFRPEVGTLWSRVTKRDGRWYDEIYPDPLDEAGVLHIQGLFDQPDCGIVLRLPIREVTQVMQPLTWYGTDASARSLLKQVDQEELTSLRNRDLADLWERGEYEIESGEEIFSYAREARVASGPTLVLSLVSGRIEMSPGDSLIRVDSAWKLA